jgi:hypothetical protein
MTKRNIATIMTYITILIGVIVIIGSLINHGNKYTEYQSPLYEMSDGVYAIYYTTHSSVPAYNYEVVTVCCNGNICTFKGNVNISFTNDEPYIKVKQYNIVNADEVYVYVPQGTVSYQPSVNVNQ